MKNTGYRAALPHPLRKAFTVPVWALVCMQSFTIWQMGIVYYSSNAFTANEVAPLPISVSAAALPITAGYLAGAALAFFFPRRVGLWARALALASLVAILLMFAPLPQVVLVLLYYTSVFTCVCFIGAAAVLAINHYSLKTALQDGIIATVLSAPFIAFLHYAPFALGFRAFNGLSALIQVLILAGLSRIPLRFDAVPVLPRRKAAQDKKALPPALLIGGTFFTFSVLCLCVLFSATVAEGVNDGISILYLASTVWAALFAWLHFKRKVNPFFLCTVFLGVTALGFILWLLPLPAAQVLSLVLQGADVCVSNLAWFFASVLFEKWGRRSVAPICVLIALATALLHSVLLALLRNNIAALYSVYAGAVLVALVIYFIIEPYFCRVWADTCIGLPGNNGKLLRAVNEEMPPERLLTKRELEVLPLLVQGYDNAAIAKLLFISENTVKTHVKSIFQKLEVHTRFELAAKVNRHAEK